MFGLTGRWMIILVILIRLRKIFNRASKIWILF
jgi:hypothetical protein